MIMIKNKVLIKDIVVKKNFYMMMLWILLVAVNAKEKNVNDVKNYYLHVLDVNIIKKYI